MKQMTALRVNEQTYEIVDQTAREELQDIRVGYDGHTYANAGEAVRQEGKRVAVLAEKNDDFFGKTEERNITISGKNTKRKLLTVNLKANVEYTLDFHLAAAHSSDTWVFILDAAGNTLFGSYSITAGKTTFYGNKPMVFTPTTDCEGAYVAYTMNQSAATVIIEKVSLTHKGEYEATTEGFNDAIYTRPFVAKNGGTIQSVTNERTVGTFYQLYHADKIAFESNGYAYDGIEWIIKNPSIGSILTVKAKRNVGNDGLVRIYFQDVAGNAINGTNDWSKTGAISRVVPTNAVTAIITLAACWGTALSSGTPVTFSDIDIRYDDVALQIGEGNTPYTGEKIVINNDDKRVHKCNMSIWKDFKSSDIPNLVDYRLDKNQSMAIHGGYMFHFQQSGDSPYGIAMDINTKEILSTFNIAPGINNHLNSAQFTDIYYDVADEFPLLLISRCGNADYVDQTGYDECLVYRVQRSGVDFAFTLVNSIVTDAETHGNSWAIDNNTNTLYMLGPINANWSVTTDNPVRYWAWKMPTRTQILSDTAIELAEADCIAKMEHDFAVVQAAFAYGGLIYAGVDREIWVVDIMKNRILSKIPDVEEGWEHEGVAIYNGKLYISQKNNGDADGVNPLRIYEFDFS